MSLARVWLRLERRLPARFAARARWARRSRFLRNVAVLGSGTVLAQAIGFVFAPLLTRLYGPDAFGLVGVFLAVVGVLAPVATLSYALAIVLPAQDAEARALERLSWRIGAVVSAIALLVIAALHEPLATAVGFDAAPLLLLLVPPAVLAVAGQQIVQQGLVRERAFRALAQTGVVVSLVNNLLKSGLGFVAASGPVLLLLTLLGNLLQVGLMAAALRRCRGRAGETAVPGPGTLARVARAYKDYPLYRAPQFWVWNAARSAPPLVLGAAFGLAAVGWYGLAERVLALPGALVANAVGTAALPRFTEAVHRGEPLLPLLLRSTLGLATLGLVPFAVLAAVSPWLFGWVFGAEWVAAGEYARWLAVSAFGAFVAVPAMTVVPLLGLQAHLLVFQIVTEALRLGGLALGAFLLASDVTAIALFALLGAVADALLIAAVLAASRWRRRDVSAA